MEEGKKLMRCKFISDSTVTDRTEVGLAKIVHQRSFSWTCQGAQCTVTYRT